MSINVFECHPVDSKELMIQLSADISELWLASKWCRGKAIIDADNNSLVIRDDIYGDQVARPGDYIVYNPLGGSYRVVEQLMIDMLYTKVPIISDPQSQQYVTHILSETSSQKNF